MFCYITEDPAILPCEELALCSIRSSVIKSAVYLIDISHHPRVQEEIKL